MKILVTGAYGFVGRNLVSTLKNIRDNKDRTRDLTTDLEIFEYDLGVSDEEFRRFCRECDFVFNLVGVHRPKDDEAYMKGNFGFLSTLLDTLKECNNTCPVMLSSSVQADFDNPYGESKRAAENAAFEYAEQTGAKVYVYRFSNLFGKWSKPNYNSVVATFCYNIAHDLPIQIRDRDYEMKLIYIDDVVDELLCCLKGSPHKLENDRFCYVPVSHNVTLGQLADTIYSFRKTRESKMIPDVAEGSFSKKLYSTYLSFLPTDSFAYELNMNIDDRGSFTEMLKSPVCGQVSVNVSRPGIIKGQHWHHTKNEKFLVVNGKGVIRFRKIDEEQVYEYYVSGDKLRVVDIPTGYTHNIENIGTEDMTTIIWANELFNPEKPDTYGLPVEKSDNPSDKDRILVLGGAGMAGHVIADFFKENGYDVTVFDMKTVEGFDCIIADATDEYAVKNIVQGRKYKAVINCIGILNKACDSDVGLATYINGYFPHYLESLLKNTDTKLVHISSDCIFSGRDEPYCEDDAADAGDYYGKTKYLGEVNNTKDITFRTSIVGPDPDSEKQSLLNWFMAQNGTATGYSNVMWTGVSTITLARAMLRAIETDLSGIYHLVNNDVISKHDLLVLFNDIIRKNKITISADDSVVSKKTLKNNRTDFDFTVPSYTEMVMEINDWIKNHDSLYSHYREV